MNFRLNKYANVVKHNTINKSNGRGQKVTMDNQAQSEYKHSLTFCVRRYVVIATKPVHRLQIRPTVHS